MKQEEIKQRNERGEALVNEINGYKGLTIQVNFEPATAETDANIWFKKADGKLVKLTIEQANFYGWPRFIKR